MIKQFKSRKESQICMCLKQTSNFMKLKLPDKSTFIAKTSL